MFKLHSEILLDEVSKSIHVFLKGGELLNRWKKRIMVGQWTRAFGYSEFDLLWCQMHYDYEFFTLFKIDTWEHLKFPAFWLIISETYYDFAINVVPFVFLPK